MVFVEMETHLSMTSEEESVRKVKGTSDFTTGSGRENDGGMFIRTLHVI